MNLIKKVVTVMKNTLLNFKNPMIKHKDMTNKEYAYLITNNEADALEAEEYMKKFKDNKWWFSTDALTVAYEQLNADYILVPEKTLALAISVVLNSNRLINYNHIDENWYDYKEYVKYEKVKALKNEEIFHNVQ